MTREGGAAVTLFAALLAVTAGVTTWEEVLP